MRLSVVLRLLLRLRLGTTVGNGVEAVDDGERVEALAEQVGGRLVGEGVARLRVRLAGSWCAVLAGRLVEVVWRRSVGGVVVVRGGAGDGRSRVGGGGSVGLVGLATRVVVGGGGRRGFAQTASRGRAGVGSVGLHAAGSLRES